MLHVILQILAIIGIVLLCILGLILLLLALVLFVPIRYRVKGSRYGEDMELFLKATYLLHMLTVSFAYPNPASVIVRLFGIRIYDSKKKEEAALKQNKESEENVKADGNTKTDALPDPVTQTQERENSKKETEETIKDKPEETVGERAEEKTEDSPKQKQTIKDKIRYTFRTICDKIREVIQKIKDIFANISYYKDVLFKIENQRMYTRVKKRLFKVLKSIRPRTVKANIRFGTGSPDTTAYLYGIYCMVRPVLGKNEKNIRIDLDFEETVYEGFVYIKGKITIFTIVVQAIKILLDKQVRKFINQLKREE